MSGSTRILLIFGLLTTIVFMPTTIVVAIGMLPTIVAVFIDRSAEKTRGLTVGAMNLAGCMPFLLKLWTTHNDTNTAIMIIKDPRTMVVIYCAAGVGYLIDWAVSGLVASVMVQAGTGRRQQIARRQAEIVERWGREVSGDVPTDRHGFPTEVEGSGQKEPIKTRKP